MGIPRRVGRVTALVLLAGVPAFAHAQSHPVGAHRVWAELGIGGASQTVRCGGCSSVFSNGGPIVSGAIGLTLPHGLGIALAGRAFQVFSFDVSQGSKYVIALGQYTPRNLAPLTFNAGMGWANHHGDQVSYTKDADDAVVAGGVALRLPARSRFALAVTADAVQSFGGTSSQPRLVSVGLALSLASARANAGSEH